MRKYRASKGILLPPRTTPNESEARREKWLAEAEASFVSNSEANRRYYSIILRSLWPPGHGIPGPILSETEIRAVIDAFRKAQGEEGHYRDPFRRMRELQGEEGFTSIIKEGVRYQLQSLETSQKREPRVGLSKADLKRLKEKYGYRCACCGAQEPPSKLSADHKIPRSRGGSNDFGNLQLLCEQCNNIKSSSCQGCALNCNVCTWAFPDEYKQLVINDQNKELIRRHAEKRNIPQSDLVNIVLSDHFKASG